MRCRAARDARSLMEIRRLAYQAQHNREAKLVLHDALLETWPEFYESSIEEAHYYADKNHETFYVWFLIENMIGDTKFRAKYRHRYSYSSERSLGWNPKKISRRELFFVSPIGKRIGYGIKVYTAGPEQET